MTKLSVGGSDQRGGKVPFAFNGVLKIDLETGEAILEPRDIGAEELAKACAVLNPA
jgi:hypothetical protein